LRDGNEDDGDGWLVPHRQPQFSENLAPLYRYLAAQVGRPWDTVYGEIRARINADSAVQYHILQHLHDDVAISVTADPDGSLWYFPQWGRRRRLGHDRWPSMYVCPRSGLICRVRRRERPPPSPPLERLPGNAPDHDYRQFAGQWYEVWWGRDVQTTKPIVIRKRQLNRRELRDLGLRR
jgi:hypothetical protein